MGQMACYDISIAIIKEINGKLPHKIFLIKDKYKGPWKYVTKYLQLNPGKINLEGVGYNNIYYIEKQLVLEKIKQQDPGRYNYIKNYNCDDLESYLCKCCKNHA
jgi:hypothetical protein